MNTYPTLQETNVLWKKLSKIIAQLAVRVRVSLTDGTVTDWSEWLTFPSNGYGEIIRHGPFLIREVKLIEINPIEVRRLGRLLPDKNVDHSEELEFALNESENRF